MVLSVCRLVSFHPLLVRRTVDPQRPKSAKMAWLTHAQFLVVVQFCKLIYPAVLLSGALSVLNWRRIAVVPGWLIGSAAVACIVPYHIAAARFRLWRTRRRAASLGAILPPQYPGKSIGNKDVLDELDEVYFHGYLGKVASALLCWIAKQGSFSRLLG